MASVKISELDRLLTITSDDFIPLVDSASYTTYRVTLDVLNDWMQTTASVLSSSYALSASYALSSSYALSASWADRAGSASYALTASYYDLSGFAPDTSAFANTAKTASCLQGVGTSWEKNFQVSASLKVSSSAYMSLGRKRDVEGESITENSMFFHNEYGTEASSNDWARIYFAENVLDSGRMVFEHGDELDTQLPQGPNIDYHGINSPGFLWQTFQASGPYATGSLMFLKTDGKLYVRAAEAREFSASFQEAKVGFYGTASHAVTAAYADTSGGTPTPTPMPYLIQGLWILPYSTPINGAANRSKVLAKARRLVVYNAAETATVMLTSVDETNNPTTTGAGGILGGAYTANQWYDLFIIYRSDTQDVSSLVVPCGVTPDSITWATANGYLVANGEPEWDYGIKIGSVYNINWEWTQWYEWGPTTRMVARYLHPTLQGEANGFSIGHVMGTPPRSVNIKLKCITNIGETAAAGIGFADEVRGEDFTSDYYPPHRVRTNNTRIAVQMTAHTLYKTTKSDGLPMTITNLLAWNMIICAEW